MERLVLVDHGDKLKVIKIKLKEKKISLLESIELLLELYTYTKQDGKKEKLLDVLEAITPIVDYKGANKAVKMILNNFVKNVDYDTMDEYILLMYMNDAIRREYN